MKDQIKNTRCEREWAMKTAEKLLALSEAELMADADVVAAYRGLGLNLYSDCEYCTPTYTCPCGGKMWIEGPIEKVAFEMRDACVGRDIGGKACDWIGQLRIVTGNDDTYNLMFATPREQIIAAVMAWSNNPYCSHVRGGYCDVCGPLNIVTDKGGASKAKDRTVSGFRMMEDMEDESKAAKAAGDEK